MSVASAVKELGIERVLHFTTNQGLLGVLASRALKSRKRLPEDKYLEHVYTPNCAVRRDTEWFDYVNLSITSINSRLFDIASNKWHAATDLWWCVLVFDPVILTHPGVYFVTTNNMYSGAERATGEGGLRALFTKRVHQYLGCWATRTAAYPNNQPTCCQAEVLYPGELSTTFLRGIVFNGGEHADTAMAQCDVLGCARVPWTIDPGVFR